MKRFFRVALSHIKNPFTGKTIVKRGEYVFDDQEPEVEHLAHRLPGNFRNTNHTVHMKGGKDERKRSN